MNACSQNINLFGGRAVYHSVTDLTWYTNKYTVYRCRYYYQVRHGEHSNDSLSHYWQVLFFFLNIHI